MSGNGNESTKRLHLIGRDGEDLAVISACLQDAVTDLTDMTYRPRENRFILIANRFRWEKEKPVAEAGEHQRIRTGLHFNSVLSVSRRGLPQARNHPLELLAIHSHQEGENTIVTLVFAGGGAIRLKAECIDCQLDDLSAPWSTTTVPKHKAAEAVTDKRAES